MTAPWTPRETTTHQDQVIAHVLGATFLGYFIFAEALYILLDIGFVWSIFVDGQMGLLPHPVAVNELEIDAEARQKIKTDIDRLLGNGEIRQADLRRLAPPPLPAGKSCLITEVNLFANGERRRLVVAGEDGSVAIETSIVTGEVVVMTFTGEEENDAHKASGDDVELEDVARSEHKYLHQRLREEMGREPTEAELDEWLRQHTEGY